MADQYFAAVEGVTLIAGTPGTIGDSIILDVASTAGARRMNLNEMGISFNGTSSTAVPVTVRLVRTTVAPVATSPVLSQAATPTDAAAPASSFTAYAPSAASAWTTRPTIGVTLRTWLVSPTSGLVIQYPLGQEPDGPATTAAGLGIQCIAPASVVASAYQVWTE